MIKEKATFEELIDAEASVIQNPISRQIRIIQTRKDGRIVCYLYDFELKTFKYDGSSR